MDIFGYTHIIIRFYSLEKPDSDGDAAGIFTTFFIIAFCCTSHTMFVYNILWVESNIDERYSHIQNSTFTCIYLSFIAFKYHFFLRIVKDFFLLLFFSTV